MRILILRPGAIGDTLLVFPVIDALRARSCYKDGDAHITLVGNMAVLPLALRCGVADEIANYEEAHWRFLFLKPPHSLSVLAPLLAQIDMVIAWLRDADGVVKRNLDALAIRQSVVAPGRPVDAVHIVQYLAATVGVTVHTPPYYAHHFATPESTPPRLLAIHPGSGGVQKCWPVEHFADLISCLIQQKRPILLLAGPADHERVHTILQRLPTSPLLRVSIDAPLTTVAAELCRCQGFIGNDSGITHLAAMLGVPTLALFGPSDPRVWQPYGRSVSIIHTSDLERLAVEDVLGQLDTFFSST
ncbi:MAG TPA: glycosyltransferase family 9 protein [Ktedonobacteraceae bacterium]